MDSSVIEIIVLALVLGWLALVSRGSGIK